MKTIKVPVSVAGIDRAIKELEEYQKWLNERTRAFLDRLAKEGCAIIYLTEQLAAGMAEDVARYKDELAPAIILIPGKEGSLGIGMANIKTAVERAVGADIL